MFATYRKAVVAAAWAGGGVFVATIGTALQAGGGITWAALGVALGAGLVAAAAAGRTVYNVENTGPHRG